MDHETHTGVLAESFWSVLLYLKCISLLDS